MELPLSHLPSSAEIDEAFQLGRKSRDVEVSNLRGQIKYLEEDKHPMEIKELVDTLVKAKDYIGNADTPTRADEFKVNELYCKINGLISKYTKS